MSKKSLVLLAGSLLLLGIVLLTFSTKERADYGFFVQGVVSESNGQPLEQATVTLDLTRPVYDVLTPLRQADIKTDNKGHFRFSFIAGDRPVSAFTLTFAKVGYQTIVQNITKYDEKPIIIKMARTK